MVIWITGLSGAGKSTLAEALSALIKPRLPELASIDGDVVRAMFGADLDYSEPSRIVQIGRLQSLAKFLSDQGLVAVVAALYASPELLAWNRTHFRNYFEVYLRAPMELLKSRDSKGLYAAATEGRTRSVVGVDIPWHAPKRPDLVFDADSGLTPRDMALALARAVPRLAAALPPDVSP